MRKRYIVISIVLILAGIIWLNTVTNEATAIGIIGGVDGPTAIFLASKTPSYTMVGGLALVCLLASGLIWLKKR